MKKSTVLLFCLCVSIAVFCPGIVTAAPNVDGTNCLTCHDAGFGDGTLHGIHTGQACNICHTSASGGDKPVVTSKCIVCHPVGSPGACPLVNAHEAKGADCLSCHADCQAGAEVAIEPATVTLQPGETQTFTASTTGGDNPPVYTWDVEGGTVSTGNTGNTTNTIEYTAGNTPGNYTITVTDTANGNIKATAAVTIEAEVTCTVTVLDEQHAKSHWVALPALIRIQTTGFEVSQATQVTFTSEAEGALNSVIPIVKLVIPGTGTINQLALIPPAILTGNFDAESETITVAVEGCAQTDTFDLKILKVGPIPLSK
jgi:hypothetical protein